MDGIVGQRWRGIEKQKTAKKKRRGRERYKHDNMGNTWGTGVPRLIVAK